MGSSLLIDSEHGIELRALDISMGEIVSFSVGLYGGFF